ncbi:MAG: GNAT family N-acetyltransferase [Holophagales bacterium]|nr:GNAT family N-acetyltransferase [Holophagales bacterium]
MPPSNPSPEPEQGPSGKHDSRSGDRGSSLQLRPALEWSLGELGAIMTRGFEGYPIPVQETADVLAWRLRYDSIDLAISQVAVRRGEPVGIALLASRGSQARLAAMGVEAEARRSGVGRRLLEGCLDHLRQRGYHRLVLEVIEQNPAAVELYRSAGMRVIRRLVGFELATEDHRPSIAAQSDAARLEAVDGHELARHLTPEAEALPWQLRPESLLALGPPARAYALDGAFAILGGASWSRIHLHALWVPPERRRHGLGRQLIQALLAKHPADRWMVAARVPEGLADDFFTALGFERAELSQLEMEMEIEAADGRPGGG